jgi:hypothetical protein
MLRKNKEIKDISQEPLDVMQPLLVTLRMDQKPELNYHLDQEKP